MINLMNNDEFRMNNDECWILRDLCCQNQLGFN